MKRLIIFILTTLLCLSGYAQDVWGVLPSDFVAPNFDKTIAYIKPSVRRGEFIEEEGKKYFTGCGGHKYIFAPGGDGGIILDGSLYSPGDTLAGRASSFDWTYFYVGGIANGVNATAACPIVICSSNEDSIWHLGAGITIDNDAHVKLTGRKSTDTDTTNYLDTASYFGIYIHFGGGVALNIVGKSRCIEVDKIKMYQKGYAAFIKNEANCDTTLDYMGFWSFRLDSINFHHVYGHNFDQDIIYDGSTGQNPTDRPITCDSAGFMVTKYYSPMAISNNSIHHCYFDSANRTGIQQGGARYGYNSIYKNKLYRLGYEYNPAQGDGIAIGTSTQNCHVYDNIIKFSFIYGVFDLGNGVNYVEGNHIDSVGFLPLNPFINADSLSMALGLDYTGHFLLNGGVSGSYPDNILLTAKPSVPTLSVTAIVRNNILGTNLVQVSPNKGNIAFANFSTPSIPDWTTDNIVCGNTNTDGTQTEIDRYTYDPGTGTIPWPVYRSTCYRTSIRIKRGHRPNPIQY